jgi:hypothetical protein
MSMVLRSMAIPPAGLPSSIEAEAFGVIMRVTPNGLLECDVPVCPYWQNWIATGQSQI